MQPPMTEFPLYSFGSANEGIVAGASQAVNGDTGLTNMSLDGIL